MMIIKSTYYFEPERLRVLLLETCDAVVDKQIVAEKQFLDF